MDETTGQGIFGLPRRLPKQPSQSVYTEAPEPMAQVPSRVKKPVVEEFVPIFELGPDLPETQWPEFPLQEFTLPDEEPHVDHEFSAHREEFSPAWEFSAPDEYVAAAPQEFILPEEPAFYFRPSAAPPIEIPATPPPPPVPQPPTRLRQQEAPQQAQEPQSLSEPIQGDSKPSIVPIGDPKPAYVRPSRPSRSRPARPSGSFAAARLSGDFSIPEIPKATFVGDELRRSGEYAAPIPAAETVPRPSEQVTSVDDPAPGTSASRVPNAPRSRSTSASTVPALILLSVLLVSYSFSVGAIESYLETLVVGSAGASSVLITLVPWVSLIPVGLLLGGVLWILAGLIGLRHVKPRARKTRAGATVSARRRKKERRKSPLELFREEAAEEDIDGDTAYQVWRLLQPFSPDNHVLSIHDDLEETLDLRPKEMKSIIRQLLPAQFHEAHFRIRIILDLLRVVKQASLSKS